MEKYKIEWSSNDQADFVGTVYIYDTKTIASNTVKDAVVKSLYDQVKKSVNYEFELEE